MLHKFGRGVFDEDFGASFLPSKASEVCTAPAQPQALEGG